MTGCAFLRQLFTSRRVGVGKQGQNWCRTRLNRSGASHVRYLRNFDHIGVFRQLGMWHQNVSELDTGHKQQTSKQNAGKQFVETQLIHAVFPLSTGAPLHIGPRPGVMFRPSVPTATAVDVYLPKIDDPLKPFLA